METEVKVLIGILALIIILIVFMTVSYLIKKTTKKEYCQKEMIYTNPQQINQETHYEINNNQDDIYTENTQVQLEETRLPYRKKYILTKNEYQFYKELRKLTDPRKYQVLTKIRLADIIEVDKNQIKYSDYYRYFNRIQSKHIDFVICDNNLHLLMAIELDDNSHYCQKTQKSDYLKDNALSSAGIQLVRCKGIGVIKEVFEYKETEDKKNNDKVIMNMLNNPYIN